LKKVFLKEFKKEDNFKKKHLIQNKKKLFFLRKIGLKKIIFFKKLIDKFRSDQIAALRKKNVHAEIITADFYRRNSKTKRKGENKEREKGMDKRKEEEKTKE
jgi:hypothetical protein